MLIVLNFLAAVGFVLIMLLSSFFTLFNVLRGDLLVAFVGILLLLIFASAFTVFTIAVIVRKTSI